MLRRDKKLMADYVSTLRSKTGMKTLFGRKNIKKDLTEGKVGILSDLPPLCRGSINFCRVLKYHLNHNKQ